VSVCACVRACDWVVGLDWGGVGACVLLQVPESMMQRLKTQAQTEALLEEPMWDGWCTPAVASAPANGGSSTPASMDVISLPTTTAPVPPLPTPDPFDTLPPTSPLIDLIFYEVHLFGPVTPSEVTLAPASVVMSAPLSLLFPVKQTTIVTNVSNAPARFEWNPVVEDDAPEEQALDQSSGLRVEIEPRSGELRPGASEVITFTITGQELGSHVTRQRYVFSCQLFEGDFAIC
jgi:hypothetical protein